MTEPTRDALHGSRRNIGRRPCVDGREHCPHFSHTAGKSVAVVVCCYCGGSQRQFVAQSSSHHGAYAPLTQGPL